MPKRPDISSLSLELVKGAPLHLDYRTAPALSVSATLDVPVPVHGTDRITHVQVIVGLTPWGQIDYLQGYENPAVGMADLEAIVKGVAARLEIV